MKEEEQVFGLDLEGTWQYFCSRVCVWTGRKHESSSLLKSQTRERAELSGCEVQRQVFVFYFSLYQIQVKVA